MTCYVGGGVGVVWRRHGAVSEPLCPGWRRVTWIGQHATQVDT